MASPMRVTSQVYRSAGTSGKAKKLKSCPFIGNDCANVEKTYFTWLYEFATDTNSWKITITAYGMDRITGPVL